jgi:hypothetical protein
MHNLEKVGLKSILESYPSCPKCLKGRSEEVLLKMRDRPIEAYYKELQSHLPEAISKFKYSQNKEGVEHVALKLYAYVHYATIRDFTELPLEIKYEEQKGYYQFDLVVEGLSHILQQSLVIGIECLTKRAFLMDKEVLHKKIDKAHYHLRNEDITHYELYFEPSIIMEPSLLSMIEKIELFGEKIKCRKPERNFEVFMKNAKNLILNRERT